MIDSCSTTVSRKSVLVLDDEAPMRRLARRLLEDEGYDVQEAATGEEAVRIAETTPGLSLVVSDVVLPGMGAAAAWQTISIACLEARVLFTSGYDRNQLAAMALLSPRTALLRKPFTRVAFLAAVRSAMGNEQTKVPREA